MHSEREPTPVLETSNENPEPIEAKRIAESVLPDMSSAMSETDRIPADFLPVVNAWAVLPEHLKAAILTLVNLSGSGR